MMKNQKMTQNKLHVVGIDYSMSCPAVTVHSGDKWDFKNCRFFYLTDRKKLIGLKEPCCGIEMDKWTDNEDRFYYLALRTIECFTCTPPSQIVLEGYAFGAKGTVFEIGENTGQLKYQLATTGWPRFKTITPGQLKKFATGKGNADKLKMHEAFVKETGFHVDKHLLVACGKSPASDIVDSYYLAKYAFYLQVDKSFLGVD